MTIASEQYYIEAPIPVDITLYQTPKRALIHNRYIQGVVLGAIFSWLINYAIGLLITKDVSRVPLWHTFSSFQEGDRTIKIFGTAMWVELFATAFLGIFLGVPLSTFFIRTDVAKGKAIPIQGNDLSKFRYLGVNFKYVIARSAYFCLPALLITYPILLAILKLACSNGGMRTMMPEGIDGPTECYMVRGHYSVLKGFYAVIAATFVSPLVEWSSLNADNMPPKTLEQYVESTKKQQGEQFLPETV